MRMFTKSVMVGSVGIGGEHPVRIQSMTNTDTRDVEATVAQIHRLDLLGCELIRVSVPDIESAKALSDIKRQIRLPLIADIHFSPELALLSMEYGADKIRINPGNMPKKSLKEIIALAKEKKIPIRIGVNSGSVEKEILESAIDKEAAMLESLRRSVALFTEEGFEDLVLSAKASSVPLNISLNRAISREFPYPLHLGVTEAGPLSTSLIRSSVGIGTLLSEGIGDTIRVSISGPPEEEIAPAKEILRCLGLRKGFELISCPTCARTRIDLLPMIDRVTKAMEGHDIPLRVAIMGCAVNGPGEARDADVGIAGGIKEGLLFRKGEIIAKLPQEELVDALLNEIERMANVVLNR